MRVQGSDPLLRLKSLLNRMDEGDKPERADDRAPASSAVRADEVRLSSRAHEIRALKDRIDASPEIRQEIVTQLREEISSGRYRIDGTRIADAMLAEQRELDAPEN